MNVSAVVRRQAIERAISGAEPLHVIARETGVPMSSLRRMGLRAAQERGIEWPHRRRGWRKPLDPGQRRIAQLYLSGTSSLVLERTSGHSHNSIIAWAKKLKEEQQHAD